MFFFFFKQKTAYEMRISDWSSDVCSSDLPDHRHPGRLDSGHHPVGLRVEQPVQPRPPRRDDGVASGAARRAARFLACSARARHRAPRRRIDRRTDAARSEEHTSELQSLMRTSYAVFCLKTKTTTHHQYNRPSTVNDQES